APPPAVLSREHGDQQERACRRHGNAGIDGGADDGGPVCCRHASLLYELPPAGAGTRSAAIGCSGAAGPPPRRTRGRQPRIAIEFSVTESELSAISMAASSGLTTWWMNG